VRVQFLSAGRVYVLAGTDWDGYYVATAWLGGAGDAETMPFVETCHRPAFEVWSLAGERGDELVIPTQVMLVADHLEAAPTRFSSSASRRKSSTSRTR
jgi:hypothetical protein